MKKKVVLSSVLLILVLVLTFSFVAAEYSLDVQLDKQTYSSGDNIRFNVILLKDSLPVSEQITVYFSDAADKTRLTQTIVSNQENLFPIEKSFISGFWKVEAEYNNKTVKRIFLVKENKAVEFQIQDDKITIKNNGNVPYTKTVQIMIGDKVIPQTVNIDIDEAKDIRLVAPSGDYDIRITDGENSLSKQNVHLTGTGQVIGALDEDISGGSALGTARDPDIADKFLVPSKLPVTFIFVGAVFGLGILLAIERFLQRKVKKF